MALTEKDIKRGEKALKLIEKFIATKEGDDILIGGRTIVAEAVALLKHKLAEALEKEDVETAVVSGGKKGAKKGAAAKPQKPTLPASNLPSLDDDEDEEVEDADVSAPKVSL